MSQWLTIIRLMYLILSLFLSLQAPPAPPPTVSPLRTAAPPWVLREEFGLPPAVPKKNRFEKLAMALSRELQR